LHVSSEDTVLNGGAQTFAVLDELLIQRLCNFGTGSIGVGRPISPLSIGVQRELRNNQQSAPNIKQTKVVSSVLVREDSECRDLFRQVFRIGYLVAPSHAQKHQRTTSDLPDNTTGN